MFHIKHEPIVSWLKYIHFSRYNVSSLTTLQDYYNISLPVCQVLFFVSSENSFFKFQLVSFSLSYKYIITLASQLVKSFLKNFLVNYNLVSLSMCYIFLTSIYYHILWNSAIVKLHKFYRLFLCNLHKARLVTKKGTSVWFPLPIFYENIIA